MTRCKAIDANGVKCDREALYDIQHTKDKDWRVQLCFNHASDFKVPVKSHYKITFIPTGAVVES